MKDEVLTWQTGIPPVDTRLLVQWFNGDRCISEYSSKTKTIYSPETKENLFTFDVERWADLSG